MKYYLHNIVSKNENWKHQLSDKDIIKIFDLTKNIEKTSLKNRVACIIHNLNEIPLYDGKPCKLRSIFYGFYKNVSEKNINKKCKIKFHYINELDILSVTQFNEINSIKSTTKNCKTLKEKFFFYKNGNVFKYCLVCKEELITSQSKPAVNFCSDKCRISKLGVQHLLETREKLGHVSNYISSKWQKEICEKIIINKEIEQSCLTKEKIIGLTKDEMQIYKMRYILCDYFHREKCLVIEFHGDFFHANPKFYSDDHIIKGSLTAKQKRSMDEVRKQIIESRGFKLMIIWENEYFQNKEETINKIRNYIDNN